jgi:chitin disaccharide deacetylase
VLIVNADDLGASPSATDPVIECFRAGVITSASGMVWLPDSERAARLAREHDLPVGLHLNLTLPFAADDVPLEVRERQLALTRAFSSKSWRLPADRAPDGPLIGAAISDQLQRFREQFGEPTHVDGHHHVHVHTAVLAHLPRELPIRPPLGDRSARPFGQRWLLRRFRGPDACLDFERLHPALGGDGFGGLAQAQRRTLAVMVHPARAQEREALLSAEWRAALAALELGSYRELVRA